MSFAGGRMLALQPPAVIIKGYNVSLIASHCRLGVHC
jgi:hypothetical protein